jgi:hypothetical protein
MADFRAIFGEDDSETEEFLGFDLDDIKEAEEKYVQQLNVLDDLDSDIEFSEMERIMDSPLYVTNRRRFYNVLSARQ